MFDYRATIANLQSRLDATITSHTLMKEELTLTKAALNKSQEENAILKGCAQSKWHGKLSGNQVNKTHFETPISLEGESNCREMESMQSRNGPGNSPAADDAIAEVKLQLAEEKNRRLDLEKELELQCSLRAETEVALKLLEKDIHEKQDTIVSLRKQLEDIKLINLEMYRKMQVSRFSFYF